jgi:hypothetical protein
LNCKRWTPVSCGGGELNIAEDEEETQLTARIAAYRFSPEGRGRERLRDLEFKELRASASPEEQSELDRLRTAYPEKMSGEALTEESKLKVATMSARAPSCLL